MIQLSQGQAVYQVVKNLPNGVTQFRVRSEDAATSFDSFNSAEFLGELQSGSEIAVSLHQITSVWPRPSALQGVDSPM